MIHFSRIYNGFDVQNCMFGQSEMSCHTKDGWDVDRGVRQNHGIYKKREVKSYWICWWRREWWNWRNCDNNGNKNKGNWLLFLKDEVSHDIEVSVLFLKAVQCRKLWWCRTWVCTHQLKVGPSLSNTTLQQNNRPVLSASSWLVLYEDLRLLLSLSLPV